MTKASLPAMSITRLRLALFALVMILSAPLLQGLLVTHSPVFSHWQHTQLALVLMYVTPAWATAVLIFLLDSYRAEAMNDGASSWLGSALRLGGLGLLTTVIALAVNPVVKELSIPSLVYLGMISPALGLAGGALFRLLTYRKA